MTLSVSRLPPCLLDRDAHILGCHLEGNAPAGTISQSGLVVIWNCTLPLPDVLLLEPHILSQFLLTRPDSWHVQHSIVEALLDRVNLSSAIGNESQRGKESFVSEEANDDFHFHFSSFPSVNTGSTDHSILDLIILILEQARKLNM
ncbi:hypothetical protein DFJ58DRAFT_725867 [Suillus subalutaceus]|uniref:uncharacterized protein n=1 Tax=Suillus subalutaceus TaxID=48586 RepID=UPI001B874885|nr:uncharacterized protein DFJ58DRAFT_725867 [Suillus subalutaceus]KAG1861177.1 hypothetical protein DFJ58DRAFT_725867 [Suillus subalutaceus]